MGSKKSKVASSTANVIDTVEIVDHQVDIQDVKKAMKLIVGLLLVAEKAIIISTVPTVIVLSRLDKNFFWAILIPS